MISLETKNESEARGYQGDWRDWMQKDKDYYQLLELISDIYPSKQELFGNNPGYIVFSSSHDGNLDFRLQKTFNIGDRVRFLAIFDVLNVFNSNTVTYWISTSMSSSLYQVPDWYFYPRRLQIGAKLQIQSFRLF